MIAHRQLLLAALVASAVGRAAGQPPPAADRFEPLRKGLATAVGDRFEFLGGTVAETEPGERFWLAKLRAREAGEFVLRYDVTLGEPRPKFGPDYDRAEFSVYLVIGKADTGRAYRVGRYETTAYPHACVGDTLTVPIRISLRDTNHRFSMPRERSFADDVVLKSLREGMDREELLKHFHGDLEIDNQARARLKLLGAAVGSHADRSGREVTHDLAACLDPQEPGRFNLTPTLDLKGPAQRPPPEARPFEIIARGDLLTALVTRWDVRESGAGGTSLRTQTIPAGVSRLRVGDRLVLWCGSYRTARADPPDKPPRIDLILQPFAPKLEPFRP
jgi:hypothetical protein